MAIFSLAIASFFLSICSAFKIFPGTPSKGTIRSAPLTKSISLKQSVAPATSSTTFDIKKYLYEKKVIVDKALSECIVPIGAENEKLCESMNYSLLAGGKRVRPILCIASSEIFGGEIESTLPTALALEMIHSMSLVHDDLPAMDNDDLRRGKPTNHVVYGEALAILAGDALLSKSFEIVAKHTKGVDAERVVDVLARLGECVGEVGLAGGQAMDLELEGKEDTTLEQLRWIHKHKTGALLKAACTTGAVLGGAEPSEVEAIERFSESIGLAFQVADDILDCTQTSEQLGKTAGKDEAVSKTTYVKLLGMDGARKEAKRLVDDALAALEPFGSRAEALKAIAHFIIEREN
uniref:Farnesyltransferase n=1 Tax=Vaucheria litorea TaxID=109269 RepID=H6WB80_VAULI|nr:farnesyltransferase [Vaucheria litorea]|mmetsp:Transcript_1166/g.1804  ORF Transcript_1166/g.1804 Transcript_1166/m.1804 type:complete len:350 (+) Transcript_1166:65-1114(+)